MQYFAIGMPGPLEWIIILTIVVIIFGVGKLPKVLGQMGKGMKAFKDGMQGNQLDGDADIDVTPDSDAAQIEEAKEVAQVGSSDLHDAVTMPASDEVADAEEVEDAEEVKDAQ